MPNAKAAPSPRIIPYPKPWDSGGVDITTLLVAGAFLQTKVVLCSQRGIPPRERTTINLRKQRSKTFIYLPAVQHHPRSRPTTRHHLSLHSMQVYLTPISLPGGDRRARRQGSNPQYTLFAEVIVAHSDKGRHAVSCAIAVVGRDADIAVYRQKI
jgi:hypothetical protein